jgi:hypothetical protein
VTFFAQAPVADLIKHDLQVASGYSGIFLSRSYSKAIHIPHFERKEGEAMTKHIID